MKHWIRYQYRKLTRPRQITNQGITLDLGPAAGTRYARSLYRDDHERDERTIVGRHLRPDDVVLELGAGLGLVTILCCQRVGSERVFTFEANPQLEPVLRRNFALNGVSPQLDLRMVSLTSGAQEFHVAERFIQSSRLPPAEESAASTSTQVDAVALGDVLARIQPTFLVMDIEGGELDLADPRVDLAGVRDICLELHPHLIGDDGVSRVVAALLSRGFSLRWQESRGNVVLFSRDVAGASAAA